MHRDVKPSNILLRPDGYAYLVDFGLAKAFTGAISLTNEGAMIGTPEYMAPEQSNGESDYRSDIYSLGVILYQMLTGRVPFTAESPVAISLKHIQHAPTPPGSLNKTIPASIEAVIMKALEKAPQTRYQQAREFSHAYWQASQQEYAAARQDAAAHSSPTLISPMHSHPERSEGSPVTHASTAPLSDTPLQSYEERLQPSPASSPSPSPHDRPSSAATTLVLEETRQARLSPKQPSDNQHQQPEPPQPSQHTPQAQPDQQKLRTQQHPPLVPLRLSEREQEALSFVPLATFLPRSRGSRQITRRKRLLRALLAFICLLALIIALPLGLLAWQTGHPSRHAPS